MVASWEVGGRPERAAEEWGYLLVPTFRQNPSEQHFLPMIDREVVAYLSCVSKAETIVTPRPHLTSIIPWGLVDPVGMWVRQVWWEGSHLWCEWMRFCQLLTSSPNPSILVRPAVIIAVVVTTTAAIVAGTVVIGVAVTATTIVTVAAAAATTVVTAVAANTVVAAAAAAIVIAATDGPGRRICCVGVPWWCNGVCGSCGGACAMLERLPGPGSRSHISENLQPFFPVPPSPVT